MFPTHCGSIFQHYVNTGYSSAVGVQVRGRSVLQRHKHPILSEVLNAEESYRDHNAEKEAHVRDTGHWTCKKNRASISESFKCCFLTGSV